MLSRLSPYWLWLLLALPAIPMFQAFAATNVQTLHGMVLHVSGETSARLLIISMIATPLMLLFKGWRGPRWLVRNRRYFGVAAFGYAALHVAAYLMTEPMARVLGDMTELTYLAGWLGFLIFLPLAATSTDWAVRKMGPAWKSLQRWVYAAAVLVLVHWAALHDWGGTGAALVQFAPLIGLTAYRLWWTYLRPRPVRLA